MRIDKSEFRLDCTGDVVKGDFIQFTEDVYCPKTGERLGQRINWVEVVGESYGEKKQQHTFFIVVLHSEGVTPLADETKTNRKGRNIYKYGTRRTIWVDEDERTIALKEKHERGKVSREQRNLRRGTENNIKIGRMPVTIPVSSRWKI